MNYKAGITTIIVLASPPNIPLSIATSSLPPFPAAKSAPYDLPSKLRAISNAGFPAIELAFPDLLSFACQYLNKDVDPKDYDGICKAGREVKRLCDELELEVMMLQPFGNFEGWKKSKEREDAFARARGWIGVMEVVGTDMLQVGEKGAAFTEEAHVVSRLTQ